MDEMPFQSLLQAEDNRIKPKSSVQNSLDSQRSVRDGLGQRAKSVLSAEQDSTKFYTKAEEINSTAQARNSFKNIGGGLQQGHREFPF